MTKIFKYEDVSIPFEHLGKCYHAAQKEAGRDPEYWDGGNARRFREFLADGYPDFARFDEDKLCRCAVNFRKKPEGHGGWKDYKAEHGIQGKRGGNGRGNNVLISPELAAHYKTPWYNFIKDKEYRDADGICRICGRNPIEEFHHRIYDNLGKPQEMNDIIGVCKICHPVCNKLWRNARKRKDARK